MKNLILLILLILGLNQWAKASYINIDNLYLETEKMYGTNRLQYLPKTSTPKYNVNGGIKLGDDLGILYSVSKVSTTVDQSQFRYMALDSEMGINLNKGGIQIYIKHYSGHLLDSVSPDRFPEENTFGVRFNLLGVK